jgi:hypothetical protein
VGGAMVWAVPIVQSLTPAAFAQYATCGCCYCWNGDKQNPTPGPGAPSGDTVSDDGCVSFHGTSQGCAAYCRDIAPGAPFEFSEQCCGTLCEGNTQNDPGMNGCFCS